MGLDLWSAGTPILLIGGTWPQSSAEQVPVDKSGSFSTRITTSSAPVAFLDLDSNGVFDPSKEPSAVCDSGLRCNLSRIKVTLARRWRYTGTLSELPGDPVAVRPRLDGAWEESFALVGEVFDRTGRPPSGQIKLCWSAGNVCAAPEQDGGHRITVPMCSMSASRGAQAVEIATPAGHHRVVAPVPDTLAPAVGLVEPTRPGVTTIELTGTWLDGAHAMAQVRDRDGTVRWSTTLEGGLVLAAHVATMTIPIDRLKDGAELVFTVLDRGPASIQGEASVRGLSEVTVSLRRARS